MPSHDIRAMYLERALQAEHWAAMFADGYFRDSWLNIAAEYRALADGKKPHLDRNAACGTMLDTSEQNPQQLPNAAAAGSDPLAVPPPRHRSGQP